VRRQYCGDNIVIASEIVLALFDCVLMKHCKTSLICQRAGLIR
jgi:hypothetical protein